MKKRTIVLIVCVSFLLVMLNIVLPMLTTSIFSSSEKCGKNLTWSLDDDNVMTISGEGDMYNYNNSRERGWKEEYTGGPNKVIIEEGVTSIGAGAFEACYSLSEVIISDSVTKIGDDAFYRCGFLNAIEIPASITTIGDRAFYNCYTLKQILVSEDNPNFSSDEFGVLFNKDKSELICYPAGLCDSIYYEIPESVTSIANYAFYDGDGYDAMCKLIFKGDAPSFGKKAFKNEEVSIYYPSDNATWEKVITKDFGGDITWVPYDPSEELVENVSSSGKCGDNATYELTFDGVLTISGSGDIFVNYDEAWKEREDEIVTIIIEEGITSIGHSAFSFCENLTYVEIPNTVTRIDDYAFSSCENLKSFTIPAGVSEIGSGILTLHNNIEISVDANNEHFVVDEKGVLYSKDKSTLVQSLNNLNEDYVIPDGVTTINAQAFRCTNITAITIPNSVKHIGDGVFCCCHNLTSVTIPDGVISIGYEAFGNCSSLTTLTIPSSVTSAEFGFFNYCANLTEVRFEGSSPFNGSYLGSTEDSGVTVYYPAGDPTWEETIENYQDGITWQAY